MTLNVNIYNLNEQNAQYVKGLNPGVISIGGYPTWLQSLIVRVNVVLNALFSIARSVACAAPGPLACVAAGQLACVAAGPLACVAAGQLACV